MQLVSVLASIVHLVLLVYILVLFARLILDYIPMFNREWRPKGFGLVAAEAVYTVTDPPIPGTAASSPSLGVVASRPQGSGAMLAPRCAPRVRATSRTRHTSVLAIELIERGATHGTYPG